MIRQAARLLAYLCLIIGALVVTGCASVGTGSGTDPERFVSALETDDVQFVRSAVQSGSVSVNQRVSAPGYPDGAPLVALAARAAALDILRYLISAGADLNARTPV